MVVEEVNMPTEEFYSGTDWEQSSGPICDRKFEEDVIWPIDDHVTDGQTKDLLAAGLHPVVAIGGLTTADGRPNNITGVVISYSAVSDIAVVNIASCQIVRAYVSNIRLYGGEAPTAWEGAPIIGQPVYVDDSADLGAGCTLSMSAVNHAGTANPLAGYLMYCQDECVDELIGGPNSTEWAAAHAGWSDGETEEHLVCVLLTNATP
jgi:hypothetical protein